MSTTEEMIKQMYGANLESQKQQLAQNYNTGNSALDETKQQNQKAADANLNRTAVEAQKQAMSDAELNNAYGLSSGALSAGRSLPAAYISDGNARNSGAEPFNRRLLNILGLK